MIKQLNGFFAVVPTELEFEFAVDPVFCFGKDMKTIDGLDASFVHRIIATEKFIHKSKTVVDADAFAQIPDGSVFQIVRYFSFFLFEPVVE